MVEKKRIPSFIILCIIYACTMALGVFLLVKPDFFAKLILDFGVYETMEQSVAVSKLFGLLYITLFPTIFVYLAFFSPFEMNEGVVTVFVLIGSVAVIIMGVFYIRATLGYQDLLKTEISLPKEDSGLFISSFVVALVILIATYITAAFVKKQQLFLVVGTLCATIVAPIIIAVLIFGVVAIVGVGIAKLLDKFSGKVRVNTGDTDKSDDEEYDSRYLDGGTYVGVKKDTYSDRRYEDRYTDERGNKLYSDDGGKTFHK